MKSTPPPAELLDRQPPSDVEAERMLLGSILLDPTRTMEAVGLQVKATDFYADAHQRLYATMAALYNADKRVDTKVLMDRLKADGNFEAVGGAAYIAEVAQCVPYAANAAYYAKQVIEASQRRAVLQAGVGMIQAAYDGDAAEEIVQRAEASLQEIHTGTHEGEPVTAMEASMQAMVHIERAHREQRGRGLMIGLESFDGAIGGLFTGELAILAARPGMGKTSLAVQVARHVAGRAHEVYFASLEMSAVELALKAIASEADVDGTDIRTGGINDAAMGRLAVAANAFSGLPWVTHDRAAMKVSDIRRAARRQKRKGLDLVVVDYLQRITPADRRVHREEQVGQMSQELKELARELEVPVLCLCQLSREIEKRGGPPILSDLRESGRIEQDADVVVFIYRPRVEDLSKKSATYEADKNAIEIHRDAGTPLNYLIVAKNRLGPEGRFNLLWQPRRTRFVEATHAEFDAFGGNP